MSETRAFLESLGLPPGDLYDLPASGKRFPDGAQYRVEIPSVEGPACLEAVLEEAERLDVRVHRVSQGGGVFLQSDDELDTMARSGAEARVEISLFARPSAAWDTSAMARAAAGAVVAPTSRGQDQVVYGMEVIRRAAAHGIRSVLIADLGLHAVFGEMRAAVDLPLDVYVEAPDNVGGFVRLHEIPELIRIGSPVYVKFGLRNAPDVYPAGTHLEATTIALSRERVRRARLGLDLLGRSGYEPATSELGAEGLAVPVPELAG